MKNLKIVVALLGAITLFSYNAKAQKANDEIPPVVTTAFSAKYSQAHLKKWESKNDTCIALFNSNKKTYKAYYTKDGNWVSTERTLKHTTSLPLAARDYLKEGKYASWHIDRLRKVETPAQTMYIAHIDNHSGSQSEYENAGSSVDRWLYFANNGKLIKSN